MWRNSKRSTGKSRRLKSTATCTSTRRPLAVAVKRMTRLFCPRFVSLPKHIMLSTQAESASWPEASSRSAQVSRGDRCETSEHTHQGTLWSACIGRCNRVGKGYHNPVGRRSSSDRAVPQKMACSSVVETTKGGSLWRHPTCHTNVPSRPQPLQPLPASDRTPGRRSRRRPAGARLPSSGIRRRS